MGFSPCGMPSEPFSSAIMPFSAASLASEKHSLPRRRVSVQPVLALRMGVLEPPLDRQPVGQALRVYVCLAGLPGERRPGKRCGYLYFSLDAVRPEKPRQILVRRIHIVRGKGALCAGD